MNGDPSDLACSVGLTVAALAVAAAYGARVVRVGAARYPRIERVGGSPLLGKGAMEMGYWALDPVARACIAVGATANGVSWASLVLAAAAGGAMAAGHFGVGAALSLASSACDAVDGMVARATGTASRAGEVLDAAIDRYAELFLFGGIAFHERQSPGSVVLTLTATAGAVMVSYATAKAEAFQVRAPRGAMRRQERAVYLVAGAGLVPIASQLAARVGAAPWVGQVPLLAVLVLVAVVGNASAIRRLRAIARAARDRVTAYEAAPEAAEMFARDAHAAAGDAIR